MINQHASDNVSLAELVRQERFAGGSSDQKDMDMAMASRIAADGRFKNDLDYADENAEKLARGRERNATQKKAFAVQGSSPVPLAFFIQQTLTSHRADYSKHKKALDSCTLCPSPSGGPPKSALVALGTRLYLGLMENEPLVEGHCRIVPLMHCSSMLELDDEGWEEVRVSRAVPRYHLLSILSRCCRQRERSRLTDSEAAADAVVRRVDRTS